MLYDHRPYSLKKMGLRLRAWYVKHYLRPHFTHLGRHCTFMKPWHVDVFGGPIELGDFATVIATRDRMVRLTVWSDHVGRITIGKCCLLCPGVRISAATEVSIGDSCMMAADAYITDCDWHGAYDRVNLGKSSPVNIGNNVWIGDSAIVCKGVTIGENSIVGAGAVVVKDVPANCVAAGNPAKVVKQLDPDEPRFTRADWFANYTDLARQFSELDRNMLADNTVGGWLRHLLFPRPGD